MVTLTISIDDAEFASLMADALAVKNAEHELASRGMVAASETYVSDPWAEPQGAQAQAPFQPPPPPPAPPFQSPPQSGGSSAGVTTAPAPGNVPFVAPQYQPPPSSAATAAPSCPHGPRKFVQGGISQKTGRPYPAFWACQGPREGQCRGVAA